MNRNTAIILTVLSVIFCGCPGLLSCFWGLLAGVISFIPGAEIDMGGSSDPTVALASGAGAMCVGLILIAIPIVVWYFTMRRGSTQQI